MSLYINASEHLRTNWLICLCFSWKLNSNQEQTQRWCFYFTLGQICWAALGPFYLPPLVSAHSQFGPGHLSWRRQQKPAGFVLAIASSPTQLGSAGRPLIGWAAVRSNAGSRRWCTKICPKAEQAQFQPWVQAPLHEYRHCRHLLLVSFHCRQPSCLQTATCCHGCCAGISNTKQLKGNYCFKEFKI